MSGFPIWGRVLSGLVGALVVGGAGAFVVWRSSSVAFASVVGAILFAYLIWGLSHPRSSPRTRGPG